MDTAQIEMAGSSGGSGRLPSTRPHQDQAQTAPEPGTTRTPLSRSIDTTDQASTLNRSQHFADGSPDHEAVYVGQVPVEVPTQLDPKSSAAQHAARVREDREDAAKEHDEILDQLHAERKRRKAERAKTAGLTTAEILAARRLGTG
jgi:hypothetical protein